MVVKLGMVEATHREHIVHYVVADHASAAFYAELRTSRTLITPVEFLTRAWRKKPDFFFHGIPERLVVPNAVSNKYGEIDDWLNRLGVDRVTPSSGFYAGVHQIRNWEKDLATCIRFRNFLGKSLCTLDNIDAVAAETLQKAHDRKINRRPGIRKTRQQLWEMAVEGRPPVRLMD